MNVLLSHISAWLLMALALLAWLLPSLLLTALFHGKVTNDKPVAAAFFVYGLLFYLALYLILDVLPFRILGFAIPNPIFGAVWILALIGFYQMLRKNRGKGAFKECLMSFKKPLLFYLSFCCLCFFLVVFNHPRPHNGFRFEWIAYEKTFTATPAHDNYFQFVNGQALAKYEPFDRYYGKRALTYEVQDREILPGVIYSVIARTFSSMDAAILSNYSFYTALGIVLNAFFLFPLFWLAVHFFPSLNPFFVTALSLANGLSFYNVYYTWFKMAGGAFFLAGLVFLISDLKNIRHWACAGVLLALGSNMHASAALGYPLILLWLTYRLFRLESAQKTVLCAFVLCAVFIGGNLPWTLVKKYNFDERYTLIRQHFCGHHPCPNEKKLLECYIDFLKKTPINTQIEQRKKQLQLTFRIEELSHLFSEGRITDLVLNWVKYDLQYVAIFFYPYLLGMFLCFFILLRNRRLKIPSPLVFLPNPDSKQLLWICLLTFPLLVATAFDPGPAFPDFLYAQPLGLVSLALLILSGAFLGFSSCSRRLFIIFCTFQFGKLIVAFILQAIILKGWDISMPAPFVSY